MPIFTKNLKRTWHVDQWKSPSWTLAHYSLSGKVTTPVSIDKWEMLMYVLVENIFFLQWFSQNGSVPGEKVVQFEICIIKSFIQREVTAIVKMDERPKPPAILAAS